MRQDVFVYISGPMTAKHGFLVEENVAAGLRAFLDCMRLGVPSFCPHLSGAFPSAWANVTWDVWLDYDLAVIDRCTHVLALPRWEESAGATKEIAYARSRGIPVISHIDQLPAERRAETVYANGYVYPICMVLGCGAIQTHGEFCETHAQPTMSEVD